jgi:hypothetical protein
MNAIQQSALVTLASRIGHPLASYAENSDCVFTEVDGVTVTVGVEGAYGVPSVRTYDGGIQTAADARSLWTKQANRDALNSSKAAGYITGHLNPIVNADWRCSGDHECPCNFENDFARRRHRSFRIN